jgi:hypothetical protein
LLEWWGGNTQDVIDWGAAYLSWFGLAFIALGLIVALFQNNKLGKIALIGFAISLGTYIFAPSTAYPRYYLPALLFASLCVAVFLGWLDRSSGGMWRTVFRGAFLFVTLPMISFAQISYTDPSKISLPFVDRQQHMSGWSSGYGLREASQYVSDESKKESEPSIVYVSDLAGMVTARLYWTGDGQMLTLWDATMGASVEDVANRVASGKPTFLIVDTDHFKANFVGLEVNPHELARFRRPFDGKPVIVYRLKKETFQFPPE